MLAVSDANHLNDDENTTVIIKVPGVDREKKLMFVDFRIYFVK